MDLSLVSSYFQTHFLFHISFHPLSVTHFLCILTSSSTQRNVVYKQVRNPCVYSRPGDRVWPIGVGREKKTKLKGLVCLISKERPCNRVWREGSAGAFFAHLQGHSLPRRGHSLPSRGSSLPT